MIKYLEGNILDSKAEALINTVNTVGIMGKGIALQFKKAFPNNYIAYKQACLNNEIEIGKLFLFRDQNINSGEKIIINFPTKKHWRNPSQYDYIESGLVDLVDVIKDNKIKSIAIPPLGSGNGGLEWEKVKVLIEKKLSNLNIDVFVYEPTKQIKEVLKKERVKLTEARALLLFVLYDLVSKGEYVSEFSSEKVAYFLQKFGGEKYFKLKFSKNFYGPYSGKVRFILHLLNGSYLMGYNDMNKKPFEPLTLVGDGFNEVQSYIESNEELRGIADRTINFLEGFYSDFGLELLSSTDYIASKEKSFNKEVIIEGLSEWSDRKRTMFSNPKYLEITLDRLKSIN